MKDYQFDYKVVPTIVGKEVCVFEFQILYQSFFRKKVIYTGSMIVNRNMGTWPGGEFHKKPEVDKRMPRIESIAQAQAEFIFKSYDLSSQNL